MGKRTCHGNVVARGSRLAVSLISTAKSCPQLAPRRAPGLERNRWHRGLVGWMSHQKREQQLRHTGVEEIRTNEFRNRVLAGPT